MFSWIGLLPRTFWECRGVIFSALPYSKHTAKWSCSYVCPLCSAALHLPDPVVCSLMSCFSLADMHDKAHLPVGCVQACCGQIPAATACSQASAMCSVWSCGPVQPLPPT